MNMKAELVVSGIAWLVIFAGAHWLLATGTLAETWIWAALAVIFVVLNYLVGRAFKKMPKSMQNIWMLLSAFGFIITLAAVFDVVKVQMPWLMSLWLLMTGAAMAVGGHTSNSKLNLFVGVVMLFSAFSVSAFGSAYMLLGSLMFGLLVVLNGYFLGEE